MIANNECTQPSRFFGYCRADMGEQFDGSLEARAQNLRDWYEENLLPRGIEFGEIAREVADGAWKKDFRKRPAASALWEKLQPGDYLVTCCAWAFRNTRDMHSTYSECVERDITFVTLDLPMSGDDKANLAAIAFCLEMESDWRAERAIGARHYAEGRKSPCGARRPWGYRWLGPRCRPASRWLSEDWLELAILLELQRCRDLGGTWEQLQEVMARSAVKLEGEKYRSVARVNGRTWGLGSIRRGLKTLRSPELQALAAKLDEPLQARLWRVDYPAILREWPITTDGEWTNRRKFLKCNALLSKR